MTVPLPRQRGHGCESAKSPWLSALTPRPLHSGQMTGAVPGCAPVPPHSRHATVSSTGTFGLAPRARTGTARAAAEDAAEQVADVEAAEVEVAEVDVRSARGTGPPVLRAVAVVLLALLLIGKHVVGRLHFLEALLGLLVARVPVGMMLTRELPVRLLDLVLRRVLRNAEAVVEGL